MILLASVFFANLVNTGNQPILLSAEGLEYQLISVKWYKMSHKHSGYKNREANYALLLQ